MQCTYLHVSECSTSENGPGAARITGRHREVGLWLTAGWNIMLLLNRDAGGGSLTRESWLKGVPFPRSPLSEIDRNLSRNTIFHSFWRDSYFFGMCRPSLLTCHHYSVGRWSPLIHDPPSGYSPALARYILGREHSWQSRAHQPPCQSSSRIFTWKRSSDRLVRQHTARGQVI